MAKLVLKFKGMVRQEYPLNNPIVAIGRSATNDIFIDNLAVSRNHAQVVRNGEEFVIEDLNSNNGTFVNGNRIESHVLKDGDSILIGKHALDFVVKGDAVLTDGLGGNQPDVEDYSSEMEGTILTMGSAAKKAAAAPPPQAAKPAPPKPQFAGSLEVLSGELSKNRYELTNPATSIGKGDAAEIRLSGFLTPAFSMVINRRDDGFYVTPGGGFFKPKLNGATLGEQTKLKSGDTLSIRSYKFQFTQK